MRRDEHPTLIYVVYPAALFDGWEVVRAHEDNPVFFTTQDAAIAHAHSRAALDGGGVVKVENWFGDTMRVWTVSPDA